MYDTNLAWKGKRWTQQNSGTAAILTHWPLGNHNEISYKKILRWFWLLMTMVSLVKLPLGDCQWTSLMISQHWFRQWLGALRQQAITWTNVDPDLCHHMLSPGHNELRPYFRYRNLHDNSVWQPYFFIGVILTLVRPQFYIEVYIINPCHKLW